MNKATKVLAIAAFAVITIPGAAMAGKGPSYICAYVNDNVAGPNFAEGYKVGPQTATAHVGPYATNGSGIAEGYYAGGLGATRVRESDLYVTDADSDNITHFTINKTDCTLTLDPTLYPSGDGSVRYGDGLAITPDGSTMFVGATGDLHIYSHTIAANGSLGATFTEASTPDFPDGIEVSRDGTTLVVAYPDIQQVCAYPISGGHLGAPNCQATAGFPTGVSIDPDSKCVYAAENTASQIVSEVAAFKLTGGVLGTPTDYNPFGPGVSSDGILVNWNNKDLYVTNPFSAQMTIGSIASGCKLTYKAIISDGVDGTDNLGQIAQAKMAHGYVVTGDSHYNYQGTPSMGVFRAHVNGNLTPIGSGQFPLMSGVVAPLTVVVVGSK
jgi:hypothetical protein